MDRSALSVATNADARQPAHRAPPQKSRAVRRRRFASSGGAAEFSPGVQPMEI